MPAETLNIYFFFLKKKLFGKDFIFEHSKIAAELEHMGLLSIRFMVYYCFYFNAMWSAVIFSASGSFRGLRPGLR